MSQSTKRILIVDDEAPLRFLLSKHLGRAGFDTATAADGPAALAALAERPFDAVVLDVVMPGMDGYEVCRRLKADPRTAAMPVVFLSASCNGDFRRRAFKLGAAEFLAKPFQTEQLPAYLRAILGQSAAGETDAERVVCVAGAHRRAGSAAAAVRLAEARALGGRRPVMLIDMELPAGSIDAQLQLSGGPNVRILLHDTGEAVTTGSVRRVSQRVHFGLEVIPAPFTPSPLGHDAPDERRLAEIIDVLMAEGYDVVLHLGTMAEAPAPAAMGHAAVVYVAGLADEAALAAWSHEWAVAGVARELFARLDEPDVRSERDLTAAARSTRPERPWSPRQPEPAGRLVAAV